MIDKINNNQIPDILRETAARQPDCSRPRDKKADASLQVSYESLLEQARQEPADETEKIERIRQMLRTGQLDNPEMIRQAAEKMVNFGI